MLVFDAEKHVYKNKYTSDVYTSVTTLLGRYKEPFDSQATALKVAQREKCTVEEILARWKTINETSKVYGTKIHNAIESYHKSGYIDPEYRDLITSYRQLGIIDELDEILSEQQVYLHEFKIAGTADIIRHEKNGCFSVFDIKTNKKFNLASQYNTRLLPPFDHLTSCEYTIYALQLSLYAYMYQNNTGRNVNQLGIFFYEREKNKFIFYPVVYLKHDIKRILETL
jgi:hypothetical protein